MLGPGLGTSLGVPVGDGDGGGLDGDTVTVTVTVGVGAVGVTELDGALGLGETVADGVGDAGAGVLATSTSVRQGPSLPASSRAATLISSGVSRFAHSTRTVVTVAEKTGTPSRITM